LRWRPELLAALAALLVLATPAFAVPPDDENAKRLEATVVYLQNVQNLDGGFGFDAGKPSDPLVSAWVTYALASFGINPADQAKPGGVDAYTYLVRNNVPPDDVTTDYERMALVATAACTSPRDFGGLDLVQRILARRLPTGAFTHEATTTAPGVNDTAFAVFPFSRLDDEAARVTIPPAVDWLLGAQHDDGSWGWSPRKSSQSVDMTGAVIQALNAGGRRATPEQDRGFGYIRALQKPDGGFPQFGDGGESNVASTAWAVQGMWSAGIDPRTWTPGPRDPLDYMGDRQRPDGSIQYTATSSLRDLWMTAQVAPAFAGHPLPIPCVPRKATTEQPTPTPSATPAGPPASNDGQGGFENQSDSGVTAGGGGEGAPLFSRPKPQSRGRTTGGAREVDPDRARQRPPSAPTPEPHAPEPEPTPTASAATTAAPTATPTSTPDGPGGEGGLGLGSEPSTPPADDTSDLPYVTGTLVSAGTADELAAAPGLRGAGAGGSDDELAALIAFALAGAVLIGFVAEARRVRG
jgi:prenyltransferase beta subunit